MLKKCVHPFCSTIHVCGGPYRADDEDAASETASDCQGPSTCLRVPKNIYAGVHSSVVRGEQDVTKPVNTFNWSVVSLPHNVIWFDSNINQWLTSSTQVDDKAPVENSAASQILGSCDRVHRFQTHADFGAKSCAGQAIEPGWTNSFFFLKKIVSEKHGGLKVFFQLWRCFEVLRTRIWKWLRQDSFSKQVKKQWHRRPNIALYSL